MSDLVEFLKAQLAEDKRIAKAATAGPWRVVNGDHGAATVDGPDVLQDGGYDETMKARRRVMRPVPVIPPDVGYGAVVDLVDAEHIVRWDPARVLREIEAKRRIVERYEHAVREAASLRERYRQALAAGVDDAHLFQQARKWESVAAIHEESVKDLAAPYATEPGFREEWRL